jgi:hypothetical protein
MKKGEKLKILKGIPTLLAESKYMRKIVAVYYVLKMNHPSSTIHNLPERMKELAEECNISQRNLYTRVKEMKKEKLVKVKGGSLILCSYQELHEILGVDDKLENYHHKKFTSKPEYILRTLAIKENFSKQEKAIKRKLEKRNKSSGLSDVEFQRQKEAVMNHLIWCFKNSVELRPDELYVNPDVAISQSTLAIMFGLKSASGGHYWQKVLEKEKLIAVESRILRSSDYTLRKSPLGTVFFSRTIRKTCCQLPNKIFFPSPPLTLQNLVTT